MIVVKVGEPKSKAVGDIWFDPTQRLTYTAIGLRISQTSNAVSINWAPIPPVISVGFPHNPNKGDVHIEPVNNIPNLFDGTSWIPAVPAGYNFPPFVPKDGDQWTESLSGIPYIFLNGQWIRSSTRVTSLPAGIPLPPGGPVFTGNGNWMPVVAGAPVNVNLAPGAAGGANNIVITNAFPQLHSAAANNITIHGPNNQMLVTINTLTGVVSYGPSYTPDAAAQVFWRAMAGASPRFLQNQIEGLVQDLKDATSRLAVAEGHVLKFTQAGYKLPEPQKPLDSMEAWERAMGIVK